MHNIYIGLRRSEASEGLIRASCYRSMKKNEEPRTMLVYVVEDNKITKILRAHCSFKAGSGGHCNHVFALLEGRFRSITSTRFQLRYRSTHIERE